MKKVYSFCASANTGLGFVDNFSSILEPNKQGFTFILKGGPGTGKSTLMRRIGDHFEKQGESVEYFYCSSDINSLDGVRIVGKNICVIDGTSPHSKDVNIVGVDSSIVNLGDAVQCGIVRKQRYIEKCLREKKQSYNMLYAYTKSALTIREIENKINATIFDEDLAKISVQKVIDIIKKNKSNENGKIRELFSSVIDKDGVTQLENIAPHSTVLSLNHSRCENIYILNCVKEQLYANGYSLICFKDVIENKIDSIYVEEGNILIKSMASLDKYSREDQIEMLRLGKMIRKQIINAGKMLDRARKKHFKIEKCYRSYIDIDYLNNITENLINKIQKMRI